MKKLILILSVVFLSFFTFQCHAFRIGGVEFSWKRGKPEWNATKTDVFCVGKGLCSGTIKFDISTTKISQTADGQEEFDLQNNSFAANLVNYQGGLAMEISSRFYRQFAGDFSGNKFSINGDFRIDSKVMQLLGFSGERTVRGGLYEFVTDPKSGAQLVLLK
ncbi:MAG: hypothetical protein IPK62_09280 [Bacteroidetes bacterium]|nr:hypothetical protein [Bacteroidota bacterium]